MEWNNKMNLKERGEDGVGLPKLAMEGKSGRFNKHANGHSDSKTKCGKYLD
jgi:hypothetical protein